MRPLALLWLLSLGAAQTAQVTVAPHDQDRRWVFVEANVKIAAPFSVVDAKGAAVAAQGEGNAVRILVPFIAAKEKAVFTVRSGSPSGPSMELRDDPAGFVSVRGPEREITRYHHGKWAADHMKPFYWPLNVEGVNVLRGAPMEPRPGEEVDHIHHTGLYVAHGDVNGRNYWAGHGVKSQKGVPIVFRRILKRESGPAYARIVAEHAWGDDLVETQDVTILSAGADAVMDFTVTLTAANGPVTIAKDPKMAKEGVFAARLAAGLSKPRAVMETDDAIDMISDSKGGAGEKAARASGAAWVHYRGVVDGKKVGVAILNHPAGFRHPTDWHVRNYGLFAANPWVLKGESSLAKGESVTLAYRLYVHGGGLADGKVPDVFAGYANAKASAD